MFSFIIEYLLPSYNPKFILGIIIAKWKKNPWNHLPEVASGKHPVEAREDPNVQPNDPEKCKCSCMPEKIFSKLEQQTGLGFENRRM